MGRYVQLKLSKQTIWKDKRIQRKQYTTRAKLHGGICLDLAEWGWSVSTNGDIWRGQEAPNAQFFSSD